MNASPTHTRRKPIPFNINNTLRNEIENIKPIRSLTDLKHEFKYSKNLIRVDKMCKTISSIRDTRGDGNCYYRACGYLYLEQCILTNISCVKDLINLINCDFSYFSFGTDKEWIIPILDGHLTTLIDEIQNKGVIATLKLLYTMFYTSNQFDLAVIKMLRYLVSNFVLINPDFTFNDLSIRTTIEIVEGMTLDTFCKNEILKLGVDARSIILLILPLVLRINIITVLLDLQAKQPDTRDNFTETYCSISPNMIYRLEDSLNFHNKDIYICLKPGHYDALYTHEFMEQEYPQIKNYCLDAYYDIQAIEREKKRNAIKYIFKKEDDIFGIIIEAVRKQSFEVVVEEEKREEVKDRANNEKILEIPEDNPKSELMQTSEFHREPTQKQWKICLVPGPFLLLYRYIKSFFCDDDMGNNFEGSV